MIKFFEHTMWISGAMDRMGEHHDKMWDEEDGFFYDVLRLQDGQAFRLKVRSMVGLLPLAAVVIFEEDVLEKLPASRKRIREFMQRHPELAANLHMPATPGLAGRRMLATVNEEKLRRILARMLDENEFFGPHGIRALSRCHLDHPFVFEVGGQEYRVSYLPGDSDSGMFGGNSNWRGPVWMPVNFLLYLSLLRLGAYYGDTFKVECPTGSGKLLTLFQVAHELAERLIGTFVRDESRRRPVFGGTEKFQTDPLWGDNILFYEYFHGDSGAGIGASHQTGWTGCIARIIQSNGRFTEDMLGEKGVERLAILMGQEQSDSDER
ncbi:MGH1-like glycoside hydrolase domain-containing protein [Tunturiibacter gelidiferens]|uniref:MGH1-like glycoside hydrolase domain-containing protein n=1 Tax=Tunturiibacter gelidiferens TaxID=3069689 RepID=UPI003D9ACF07